MPTFPTFVPRILTRAPFEFSGITIELSDHEWSAPPQYDALATAAWQQQLASATHPLWDGTYYRVLNVSSISLDSALNRLTLGTIPYRYIATFRSLAEHHSRLGLAPLYHLSTAGLVRTTDDFYLFGKQAWSGAIELIGGGAQPNELPITQGADLRRNLWKELREEAGIHEQDITRTAGLGIVLSETSNVVMIAHLDCRLTKAQAEARFGHREEQEMSEPVFVSRDRLNPFLAGLPGYRNLIPALL